MKTAAAELFLRHKFARLPALESPVEPSWVFALQLAESQVDVLRQMVPKCEVPAIDEHAFDESLDLRYQGEAEWDRAYEEAAGVYRVFSREFGDSMGRDGSVADGQSMRTSVGQVLIDWPRRLWGHCVDAWSQFTVQACGCFDCELPRSVLRGYVKGTLPRQCLISVRTSVRGYHVCEAHPDYSSICVVRHLCLRVHTPDTDRFIKLHRTCRYHYGYLQKNAIFSWIGLPYLNRIRAGMYIHPFSFLR